MIISSQKQNRVNKKSVKMSKSSAKSGTDFSIAAIMGRNAMQDDIECVSSKNIIMQILNVI
jgi:hypothetical protein